MIEDTPDEQDVTDLAQLISEVSQLNNSVRATEASLKGLTRSSGRHRLAIILGAIGLTVDLGLTVAVFHLLDQQSAYNDRQTCINGRSARFFDAEHDKVAGQVKGLKEIRGARGDRAKTREGFDQFIAASQHYLDAIANLPPC